MRSAVALLRRERDFRRIFLAALVSMAGDWFALVPLVTLLAELTGGGLYGGIVLAVDTIAFALIAPYGGVLADRHDRRRLMVGAELASAAAAVLLLAVTSKSTAWLAVVSLAAIALAKGIFSPASTAALPNLVDSRDLATANVLTGAAWGSMLAAGAALSGLLAAATSPRLCFAVDAASFLVSAALTASTRRPMQQARRRTSVSVRRDVATAVRFARANPPVRQLLLAKAGVGIGNGTLVLFPLYATQLFGVGAIGAGLLYAARGLGALLWPVVIRPRLRAPALLPVTITTSMGVFAACYLGVAVAPAFAVMLVLVVLAHVGGGANWMLATYGLQVLVPDEVRGRIASADWMLATLAIGLSQLGSGVLSGHVSLRVLTAGFAAVSLAYATLWYAGARRAGFPAAADAEPVRAELPAEVR